MVVGTRLSCGLGAIKKQMVKMVENMYMQLGSWAQGSGIRLKVMEAATDQAGPEMTEVAG